MASVCPVNRVLRFGTRGMTPIVLLPWMLTCNRFNAIALPDGYFTHSFSFNECAVASVKVVSTRKETRSAHVVISKMDVKNEGGQERTAPKQWKHPQSSHKVNACPCLFLQISTHMPTFARAFPTLRSSPSPHLRHCHSSVVYCPW